MALFSFSDAVRELSDCKADSSACRRLRGERGVGDMVVRAVWKEVLLWALEEGGMGLRFVCVGWNGGGGDVWLCCLGSCFHVVRQE